MTPQELKNSILQLAIQGRLVEQRPEEGTGEELYQQIQAEKQALIKVGKIKKEKPLPEIAEDEVPFEIPESWKWVRWGNLSESIQYGYNAPAKDVGRIKMVRISDIQDGKVLWETVPYCEISEQEIPDYLLSQNDILFARTGGTVGKSFLVKDVPEDSIYAGYLIRTRYSSLLCPEYMKFFMESQLYWSQLRSGTIATAQPNCNGKTLSKMILPLPPLAEQKRIVAKIEELLPLIDRYEKAWSRLEEFNKRFPGDMQKSILQLAIQGRLVEQRPEEGTGEELYQQIQAEKQALIKAGKIKKEKPLPEITEDEMPFEIPESWKWVRLGSCTSYAHTKEKVSSSEIDPQAWSLDLEDIEKDSGHIISFCKAKNRRITGDKVVFHKDQILYSKLRPYLKKILVAPKDGICTPELVPFYAFGNIDASYLVDVLKAPHVDYVINAVTYGVKMPRVGTETMVNLLVPLPPLAEQKRIVAKIEELLPLCERLK